ncbi:hypothetical protein ACQUQU_03330 [Thalassolituus sp. LLYu03]|uniref:hypothetical protein n=1 Tax=Thalassolituus sp. LLYu03 TaxID=3421656 RepID=UPI003D28D912
MDSVNNSALYSVIPAPAQSGTGNQASANPTGASQSTQARDAQPVRKAAEFIPAYPDDADLQQGQQRQALRQNSPDSVRDFLITADDSDGRKGRFVDVFA